MTKDKHIIVSHGPNGEITHYCQSQKIFPELTFAEIRELDAGDGEKIPELDEVFSLCKGKIRLTIEIKAYQHEEIVYKLYSKIKQYGLEGECSVISCHQGYLEKISKLSKGRIPTGCLLWRPADKLVEYMSSIHFQKIIIPITLIKRKDVKYLKSLKKIITVYVTAGEVEEELYGAMMNLEPNILCINYPMQFEKMMS